MKKIITTILLFVSLFVLVGCGNTTVTTTKETTKENTTISETTTTYYKEEKEVSILVPNGTPALSQMYIEANKANYNYKVDVVNGADTLAAAFTSKSYDFIYAPLNLGAKLYVKTKNYKLLALTVNCNYYFVTASTTEDIFDINQFIGKDIYIFGEAAMSGILARLILETNGKYTLSDLNITYVSSVADSQSAFIAASNKANTICLVAEPSLSVLKTKVADIKTISLTDEYAKINSDFEMPQAAVFVRSDIDKDVANRYLGYLEESIGLISSDVNGSAELGSTLYTSFTKEVLEVALPNSSIKFTKASDAKTACKAFFKMLDDYNTTLIGGEVDEGFYFA